MDAWDIFIAAPFLAVLLLAFITRGKLFQSDDRYWNAQL